MQFLNKRIYLRLYVVRALLLVSGLCLLAAILVQVSHYQSVGYWSPMAEQDATVYKLSPRTDAAVLETVTVSNSLPMDSTDWTRSIELPKFDASLGTLTSAAFEIEGELSGSVGYENLEPFLTTVQLKLASQVTVYLPNGVPVVAATPTVQIEEEADAFDGGIDFSGSSGQFFIGLSATEQSTSVVLPVADLPDFVGQIGQSSRNRRI